MSKYSFLSEAVRQIVYQHHETMNGDGFPLKLTGMKIYPLAKIVSFVDTFANIMANDNITPLLALKKLLNDQKKMQLFDTDIVKALVKGFIR